MANPYTERLQQLDGKRVQSNVRQLSDMVGLPIRRPGEINSPSGVPTGKAPIPQEDESYKQSAFWGNFDHHRQNDPHFDAFTGELTKLATGLRKQVEAGYMPPQVAQDNLHQFVMDSFAKRGMQDPQIQKQKQEQQTQQITSQALGALAQQASANPTPDSQMAQPAPTPAIQNLSQQAPQGGM